MQLVVSSYGAYLQKSGDCFKVRTGQQLAEISSKKVSSILISTSACLSTDAVRMALENNIDIVFLDEHGNPYGRIWHPKLGSTTLIRRQQLRIADTPAGLELALGWVKAKFQNQLVLLSKLRTTRPTKHARITFYITSLTDTMSRLHSLTGTIEVNRSTILGIEGSGGRVYFEALSFLLPDRYRFTERSRDPAKDEFNALLNYSYGVLYSKVEKACIIAGLDPYAGFIHTDRYNKRSLVFDLMENYRIWADEVVISLFASRRVKGSQFDEVVGGYTLSREGKMVLLSSLSTFMEGTIRYKGKNMQRQNVIQMDCHNIANRLISIAHE